MWRTTSDVGTAIALTSVLALTIGCGGSSALEEIPVGSEVTITTADGRIIDGTLTDVSVNTVVVESEEVVDSTPRTAIHTLSRDAVAEVRPTMEVPAEAVPAVPEVPEPVLLTIPADTEVEIELETTLTSDGNRVEDTVRARTRAPITVGDSIAVPLGSEVVGHVTDAVPSGDVRGLARLAFRFSELRVRGERHEIRTAPHAYQAEPTKGEDAKTIGIGAAAGALIGGLAGGRKGAAVGTAIGGGAGTAMVVTTPGDEVRLGAGRTLRLRLLEPVTLAVPSETP